MPPCTLSLVRNDTEISKHLFKMSTISNDQTKEGKVGFERNCAIASVVK